MAWSSFGATLHGMPIPIRVLAAVIAHDDRWLLGLRPHGKRHAGRWEFPGGKVEAGESDHEALARELREELGLTLVSLGAERCVQRDGDSPFTIVFVDAHVTGTPTPHEHVALAWVAAHEFVEYALAPSDLTCAAVLADGTPVAPPEPVIGSAMQVDAYLESSTRDAMAFNEGLLDLATYTSYVDYACQFDPVRAPLRRLVMAQADLPQHTAHRDGLLALAERIAALPPTPCPAPPPPPRRPDTVILSRLQPGDRVRVCTRFETFDGEHIEAGRVLTFVRRHFFPYDDGHTFTFEEDGFRLSRIRPGNGAVLDNEGGVYFTWEDAPAV
jgi:mutator protein MutT